MDPHIQTVYWVITGNTAILLGVLGVLYRLIMGNTKRLNEVDVTLARLEQLPDHIAEIKSDGKDLAEKLDDQLRDLTKKVDALLINVAVITKKTIVGE